MQQSESFNWVYLMRCQNGSLYAGWTNDLGHRVYAHTHDRGSRYTRAFGASALAYARVCASRSEALREEAALKKLSKARKEELCREFSAEVRPRLRTAVPEDLDAILHIYDWYVLHSTATFRDVPLAGEERSRWLAEAMAAAPVILAHSASGRLMGFALVHPWRGGMGGYRWDVETSVYCAPEYRAFGVGAPLYAALLEALRRMGYYNAYAVLTEPNRPSEAFHRKCGFVCQARHARIGYKDGRWLGISVWQAALRPAKGAPAPVRPLPAQEIQDLLQETLTKFRSL